MIKKWIKTNPCRALLILLFSVILQIFSTISYYLVNPMLNAVMAGDFKIFFTIIISKFIVDQISNGSLSYNNYLYEAQTQNFYHDLREKNVNFFVEKPLGLSEMENDLTSNLELLSKNYFMQIFIIFNDLLYVICVSAALLSYSWILVTYSFTIAIISLLIPKIFKKISITATNNISVANNKFLEAIYQWIIALNEIRRYRIGKHLVQEVCKVGKKLEESAINQQNIISFSTFCQDLVELLGIFGIPIIAGVLYFQNKVQFGTIVAAGYLANGIFSSLSGALSALTISHSTQDVRKKLIKQLKKSPGLPISQLKTIIAKKCKVKFNNNNEVTLPDFKISYGEHVLLTGASGSGKSTLLQVITGQEKISSGKIEYFDYKGKGKRFNLSQLGYLPQKNVIFPGTILENITMFNKDLEQFVEGIIDDVQLTKDLKYFKDGIHTKLDPDKLTLSGGQKQKIFLARVLIHHPSFLILDESLSAIDEKASTLIIKKILKEKTVLLVAHNLSPEQRKMFMREVHL